MANTTSRQRQSKGFKRLPKGKHGGVELLLIHSVDHLGRQGEVVEVKAGFANNYLLPQGLATIATDHHKRMVDKHKSKLIEIEKARLSDLQELADQLAKLSVTIEANANNDGHLYGSVGANDISSALKQLEYNVLPELIKLEGVMKELGLYTVKVQLHQDVQTELKVWVVPTVSDEDSSEKPVTKK